MNMPILCGRRLILLAMPLAAWAVAGCKVEQPASHGECAMNAALSCDTAVLAGNPDAGVALGLAIRDVRVVAM